MPTGATGTPTTNYSIPKYATSSDAPSGVGFNNAMDAIDLALLALDNAKIDAPASPSEGDALVYTSGAWAAGTASNPSVTPVQWLNPLDSNSFWTVEAYTAGTFGHWQLANASAFIYGQVLVPSGVTSATLRVATAAALTTGAVRLALYANAVADGEAVGGSWGAGNPVSTQDITVPGTAYLRKDVTWSLTGLAGGDLLMVALNRDGAHANDTYTGNLRVYGAWLEPA